MRQTAALTTRVTRVVRRGGCALVAGAGLGDGGAESGGGDGTGTGEAIGGTGTGTGTGGAIGCDDAIGKSISAFVSIHSSMKRLPSGKVASVKRMNDLWTLAELDARMISTVHPAPPFSVHV